MQIGATDLVRSRLYRLFSLPVGCPKVDMCAPTYEDPSGSYLEALQPYCKETRLKHFHSFEVRTYGTPSSATVWTRRSPRRPSRLIDLAKASEAMRRQSGVWLGSAALTSGTYILATSQIAEDCVVSHFPPLPKFYAPSVTSWCNSHLHYHWTVTLLDGAPPPAGSFVRSNPCQSLKSACIIQDGRNFSQRYLALRSTRLTVHAVFDVLVP